MWNKTWKECSIWSPKSNVVFANAYPGIENVCNYFLCDKPACNCSKGRMHTPPLLNGCMKCHGVYNAKWLRNNIQHYPQQYNVDKPTAIPATREGEIILASPTNETLQMSTITAARQFTTLRVHCFAAINSKKDRRKIVKHVRAFGKRFFPALRREPEVIQVFVFVNICLLKLLTSFHLARDKRTPLNKTCMAKPGRQGNESLGGAYWLVVVGVYVYVCIYTSICTCIYLGI